MPTLFTIHSIEQAKFLTRKELVSVNTIDGKIIREAEFPFSARRRQLTRSFRVVSFIAPLAIESARGFFELRPTMTSKKYGLKRIN